MKTIQKPLVFIVEDNEAYAEMIRFQVHKRNYNTIVYHTGEDCLRNLYQIPDIIILDYMLGSMDGLEVLKQVKSINPDIQVIFLSSQEDLNVGINSLKYGAYDYVIKEGASFDSLILALTKITRLKSMLETRSKKKKLLKVAFTCAFLLVVLFLINLMY